MKLDMRRSILLPAAILLVILVLVNMISRNWFLRLDLTDNKIYSLSESSRSVVSKIDDLLTMKVYFSDNLPGEYGNNRRYLQDILEEYEAYSNGNIRFEFYSPETDEDLEKDAQKSGIQPVQLQVVENDKLEVKKVFMGMVILYEDKREVIPVIQTTTGLEYAITTKIKKLVDTEKKILAIARTGDETPANDNITNLLRQSYQVRSINLKNPIPETIRVILMNGVQDSLTTEEEENLKDFIARGGGVLLAQGRVKPNLRTQRGNEIKSNIFDLLDQYGLHIQKNLVLDRVCGRVNVMQNMGFFRMNVPMEYPFLPIIRNFNADDPVVGGLEQMQLIFPSEIKLDSVVVDSNISVTPLLTTSNHTATMSGFYNLSPDPQTNPLLKKLNQPKKILAARAEIINPENNLMGQIILVSDSEFLLDDGGGASPENHVFVLNAVDYLMGDRELIALRSREITNRPLKEISDDAKRTWKWVNIVLPSLLIVAFGFYRMRWKKRQASILEELYD